MTNTPTAKTKQDSRMEFLDFLYAVEMNAGLSWFWDGGIDVWLGDDMNGKVETNVDTISEAIEWLKQEAFLKIPELKTGWEEAQAHYAKH